MKGAVWVGAISVLVWVVGCGGSGLDTQKGPLASHAQCMSGVLSELEKDSPVSGLWKGAELRLRCSDNVADLESFFKH